ncbi:MAG: hypothetical protein J0I41_10240 [Filimonas sp.]|nr:hypothetical protein [Filimonas sp.]
MQQQNYNNHVRYYAPHHFIFYPILLVGIILSLRQVFVHPDNTEWVAITGLFILTGWLSFMLRQHYALINQNRIVRLEMRFRYFVLTGQRLELLENQLTFGQIAALRFASDSELPALVQRAISENLSPKTIKQSIEHWLPDTMRV